jgi:ribonuclease HI
VFYRLSHPLREKLGFLGTMNMSRCIQGYSNVLSMDITPSESFTRHELSALLGTPLVDMHMENALAGVRDTMYPLVAPRELSVVASEYVESAVFYTDGSLIEGIAGFAVHRTGVDGFGFKLSSPAGVFSAQLSALLMALPHIREVIQPPEKCLILTDSLSLIRAMMSIRISWRTHPLVYECKQLCFDLMRHLIEVKLMWIPSHVGLVGNELVDG